jgi:endonuclease G
MHLDAMTIARARLALREAVRGWLFDPNVNLIDFGYPEQDGRIIDNEVAIRFHVRRKLSGLALEAATETGYTRPVPAVIGGFPTDVPQGTYRPQQWRWWQGNGWHKQPTNQRTRRADPMLGGMSISDERHYAYGTLGGKVVDRTTGDEMILSNWHVLAADWRARRGQRIYQPGRLDQGTRTDTVASLNRDAMPVNLDAAVATLNGDRRLVNEQIEIGPVRGVAWAMPGMEVVKSGRGSGKTYGRVTAIEGTAKIRYDGLYRVIRQVMTIEPLNGFAEVSRPGDSGAWWMDMATRQVIGLHFAGSNFPERALAMDMQPVLDALSVTIVTQVEHPAGMIGVPQITIIRERV